MSTITKDLADYSLDVGTHIIGVTAVNGSVASPLSATVSYVVVQTKCYAPTFSITDFLAKSATGSYATLSVTNNDPVASTIHYSISISQALMDFHGSGTFTLAAGTSGTITINTSTKDPRLESEPITKCSVTLYTTYTGLTNSDSVTEYASDLASPSLTSSYAWSSSKNQATITITNSNDASVSYKCVSAKVNGNGTLASGASVTVYGVLAASSYSGTATVTFTYETDYTASSSISYNNHWGEA